MAQFQKKDRTCGVHLEGTDKEVAEDETGERCAQCYKASLSGRFCDRVSKSATLAL